MNLENLSAFDKDTLLRHFFHHLAPTAEAEAGRNSRDTIGKEYPLLYNRLWGRAMMEVTWPHEREQLAGLLHFADRALEAERAKSERLTIMNEELRRQLYSDVESGHRVERDR